nr:dihydroxyacetone kinase subunit DhaK [uncultured Oscillibacter sp.]
MPKKIMNRPEDFVHEATAGFLAAHGDRYTQVEDVSGLRVIDVKEKTAVVVGGGSGHEPIFGYFIGENLADAAAAGNVFTSPDPGTILKVAASVERGKGVLFVYGNYAGDNMNFDIAAEMLDEMGIETKTVRVCDDVASAPKERYTDRRGIAGNVFVIKIAGAATASGLSLEEAYRVTAKARDHVYSMGIALSSSAIPGEKHPIFDLADDEMEYGVGIHGEAGIRRTKLMPADQIVENLTDRILEDSGIQSGDTVCSLVNGLGATPLTELYIMNRRLSQLLREKGIHVHRMEVGTLITSMEMAGASITLMKLDDELQKYYDMPCNSPYYKK